MIPIRAGVVTVSDKGHAGERKDVSGPLLAELLCKIGAEVVRQEMVPDEQAEISRVLIEMADEGQLDLIVTTGGSGLTPRDVTPEATLAVIERETPGLAEVLRFEGYRKTPLAVLFPRLSVPFQTARCIPFGKCSSTSRTILRP